jgi:hypothetical protein
MKKNVLLLALIVPLFLKAQVASVEKNYHSVNLSLSLGKAFSPSVAGFHNWRMGKSKKFEIGLGARYSGFFGKNLNYITAPAKITSGKTGPGVLFTENIAANIDTLRLNRPQTHSVNLALQLGYTLSPRLFAAFNIDLLGFSFGRKFTDGIYIRNGLQSPGVSGKTSVFNALLISDNDRGSLNSELYLRYKLNHQWALQAGGGFIFSEYTTTSKVQQVPEPNDRFRYKSAGFLIGVTKLLR